MYVGKIKSIYHNLQPITNTTDLYISLLHFYEIRNKKNSPNTSIFLGCKINGRIFKAYNGPSRITYWSRLSSMIRIKKGSHIYYKSKSVMFIRRNLLTEYTIDSIITILIPKGSLFNISLRRIKYYFLIIIILRISKHME